MTFNIGDHVRSIDGLHKGAVVAKDHVGWPIVQAMSYNGRDIKRIYASPGHWRRTR